MSSPRRELAQHTAQRRERTEGRDCSYGLLLVTDTVAAVGADTRRVDRSTSRWRAFDRRFFVDLAIGTSVIAALALPILLNSHAFFGDWGSHLYLVDQQTRWLRSHFLPTYFVHSTESGVFYPHYMFYGGSLYAFTGWLGVLLGSSVNAFRLTFVMAFAACYFGTLWIGRQLGIRGLLAHIPATIAVSGAYYVSKAYYDGGWPEFIAVSMIPLIIAATLSIIRSKRVPLRSATLLVASTFLLTGSHNVTIEYASLFLAAVILTTLIVYRRSITRSFANRFAIAGALVVLSAALNGWFLVPLSRYAHLVRIAYTGDAFFSLNDHVTRSFDAWRIVFSPWPTYPTVPNGTPFYVQVSVYALVWLTCLGAYVLLRTRQSRDVAMYFSLIALLCALLALVLWQGIWDAIPNTFKVIQFRYRLHTYINFTIVGLVIVGLVLLARSPRARAWFLALLLAAVTTLGFAVWQAWSAPTYLPVGEIAKPGKNLPPIEFANCPAPCPSTLTDYRMPGDIGAALDQLNVDVARARKGTVPVRVPNGGPYRTNIAWNPLIELRGPARIVGATLDGWAVIERSSRAGEATVSVHVREHATSAVVIGRVVSSLAAATLAFWLVAVLVLRGRKKRSQFGN
jgi:hypothetical protein